MKWIKYAFKYAVWRVGSIVKMLSGGGVGPPPPPPK